MVMRAYCYIGISIFILLICSCGFLSNMPKPGKTTYNEIKSAFGKPTKEETYKNRWKILTYSDSGGVPVVMSGVDGSRRIGYANCVINDYYCFDTNNILVIDAHTLKSYDLPNSNEKLYDIDSIKKDIDNWKITPGNHYKSMITYTRVELMRGINWSKHLGKLK